MSDDLDPKTFNLAEVLSGRAFPQETIKVIFDEQAGYAISKQDEAVKAAQKTLDALEDAVELDDDAIKAAQQVLNDESAKLDALIADAKELLYSVTVRAVARKYTEDEYNAAYTNVVRKKDLFGNIEVTPEVEKAEEKFTVAHWALHIIEVKNPEGAVDHDFNKEKVKFIRGNSPAYTLRRIQEAINGLYSGSQGGFETAAQETGFLSDASPED